MKHPFLVAFLSAIPLYAALENPYARLPAQRTETTLAVDLGYESYLGIHDPSTGLDTWRGLRFAEPPIHRRRWQKPIPPEPQHQRPRKPPIAAHSFAKPCPQTPSAAPPFEAFHRSQDYSEDCLFLNVWAPPNATSLPVMVWIHGGGYGSGNSYEIDIPALVTSTGNRFVAVAIVYRLGAFGFLASHDVQRLGTLNAGLHDQILALQWVQRYVSLFGGDPSKVTIAGKSAGAGSVMLLLMAFGGRLGTHLFQNAIASSPYAPMQHHYTDALPNTRYHQFADYVGCPGPNSTFGCLVEADTYDLQNASHMVSQAAPYGQWAFSPVTDGVLVQQRPSQQLGQGLVNGRTLLVGTNSDEGPSFVPPNITTADNLADYIRGLFPSLTSAEVDKVLHLYHPMEASVSPDFPRFATTGVTEPSAINVGSFAAGHQQRANNLYAEVTILCPAYWMAEAFTLGNKTSYKYQVSAVPGTHAADLFILFGPRWESMSDELQVALRSIWRGMIQDASPTTGYDGSDQGLPQSVARAIRSWPSYASDHPVQLNLNQTGGQPTAWPPSKALGNPAVDDEPSRYNISVLEGPGLISVASLEDAFEWEQGRGKRCEFWSKMGMGSRVLL
ncbi:hypothetical protein CNMCM5793_003546 [Aspergillus hiratsukae]|uniref:Carboxylic ester hydrolase n=1 Tax=Aspergillus hiratsukae TaxID=1194566 RepID=A0A8H6UH93_9EURO|nr:hypothetical protein CNMCM5793_003546 [Aspergillus hiratsukae]